MFKFTEPHAKREASRRRRGAAAVEFAVVCPVLFLVMLGMIEVGRAVTVQNLLSHVARDAARAASLDGSTAASVQAQATERLNAMSMDGVTVTVSPDPLSSAAAGDPVTVNLQVPFDSVSWLPSDRYFQGVTLQSTVVMRRETTE